jgi:hypothetical protein
MLKKDFNWNNAGRNPDYNGNPFPTYESQVNETSRKYDAESAWGCQITKNIIDVRAALTIGTGVQPKVSNTIKDESTVERELAFIKELMSFNKLNGKMGWEWAREAEIEGKFLCKLTPDPETKQIHIRFICWMDRSYNVLSAADDYTDYESVEFYDAKGSKKTFKKAEFVYGKFGGRTSCVNKTPTKVGAVLGEIEAIAKALRDMREINHLFASPTPTVTCEDSTAADELFTTLTSISWKIGKLLVIGGADFKMVGPPIESYDSLEREVTMNAKIISGSTGLPVHFIGFPDLMSNRSTSDSSNEMLFASMAGEKQTWEEIYRTIFEKAMAMSNESFSTNFNTRSVVAEIPESSQTKMRQIIDFWVELRDRKAISLETLIEKIPNVDSKQEMSRLREELDDEIAQMMDTLMPKDRNRPANAQTKQDNREAPVNE